jgi:recombination protein RecA
MEQTKRKTALAEFMKNAVKTYGNGIVSSGNQSLEGVEVISTGSIKIDAASGIGGLPKGRMIEIFGEESSGKTTLGLQLVAECQKAGGQALFVDVEHALDPVYATNLGVDLEKLMVSQPDNAESALGIIKDALTLGAFDIIVLDSVAGLATQAEIDGDVGDAHVAKIPRLMSQNLKQFTSICHHANTLMVFINQTRSNIGQTYGDPNTATGGKAIKFYMSMRIKTIRTSAMKDGEETIGNKVKVTFVKNKLAAPFKVCEPEILYGEGFSRELEIIDIGSENGIIEKAGSWYNYAGERLGQGRDNVRQLLIANPTLTAEIEAKVRASM